MDYLTLVLLLTQLGNKPWCTVLPNTPTQCHAQTLSDCDSVQAKYCIWDSKEDCEKNKLYNDEKCEVNNNG